MRDDDRGKSAASTHTQMLNMDAITEAIRMEINKQQAEINYDDMAEDALVEVIEQLQNKLALAKAAQAAKKDTPKMVAKKSEGSWPELPWGGACHALSLSI